MAGRRGANSAEVYGFVGYLTSTLAYGAAQPGAAQPGAAATPACTPSRPLTRSALYRVGGRARGQPARVRHHVLSEQVRCSHPLACSPCRPPHAHSHRRVPVLLRGRVWSHAHVLMSGCAQGVGHHRADVGVRGRGVRVLGLREVSVVSTHSRSQGRCV